MTRRFRYKPTTYGQKGGEGPNKGKKRALYEATGPDGKVQRAGMMVAGEPPVLAYMRFYGEAGTTNWKASGVREKVQDWGGVWVPAKLVEKTS